MTSRLIYILHFIALGWMCLSAFSFQMLDDWWIGAAFAAVGCITLGIIQAIAPAEPVPIWGVKVRAAPVRVFIPLIAIGVMCLLIVAEASGNFLGRYSFSMTHHLQFVLWLVGIVSLAVGMMYRAPIEKNAWMPHVAPWLIVITLIGFALRIWNLETAVHHFVDEMNFGRAAWLASERDYVPLLAPFSKITAFPWLYPYWQSLGMGVFGHTLTALRFVSVIFGTLTIPAVYWLGVEIFDRPTALAAALLLATFPPHVHFSRLGLNNIADPFFGVMTLVFLIRALKYQHQRDYVLAGVMLGLTQYFYEGGRILFPVLMLFWLEMMAITRRIRMDGWVTRRVGLFVLVALIVAFPVYYALAGNHVPLLSRFDTAGIGGNYYRLLRRFDSAQSLDQHIFLPFTVFLRTPDNSLFYGGDEPLLLLFVLPFFLLGVGYAFWRVMQPGIFLLLLWVLGTSVGNAVLADSAYIARFVVVFPAVVLLMAAGVRVLFSPHWAGLRPAPTLDDDIQEKTGFIRTRQRRVPTTSIGFALLITFLAAGQGIYYFGIHLPIYNQQLRIYEDSHDVIFRAAAFSSGTKVCLITDVPVDQSLLIEMRDYLAPHISDLCFIRPGDLRSTELPAYGSIAFFIGQKDERTLNYLREHWTLEGPFFSPFSTVPREKQFVLYHTAFLRSNEPALHESG